MGNYRQHLSFASGLGLFYAAAAFTAGGVHWIYGSVAALLAALGGLLPDLDSPTGFGLKGFTGIMGVLAAAAVWRGLSQLDPPPAFEFHLWAMLGTYALVRHGLRRVIGRIAVHRGMCHSLPTCGICGAVTYLIYPSSDHTLRTFMAVAVMLGVGSHLLLDEICSVDLRGARVNKAFGTALKFWAPSAWSTLAAYGLLSWLTYQVVQVWPDGPAPFHAPPPPQIPLANRLRQLEAYAQGLGKRPGVAATIDRRRNVPPAIDAAVTKAGPVAGRVRPADPPRRPRFGSVDAGPPRTADTPPAPMPVRGPSAPFPPAQVPRAPSTRPAAPRPLPNLLRRDGAAGRPVAPVLGPPGNTTPRK